MVAAELIQRSTETYCINLQRNGSNKIVRNIITEQDNDPKHIANTSKNSIGGKKWKVKKWNIWIHKIIPIK